MEGGNDPVLMMKAISTCILQLKEAVEQHWKATEAEVELKELEPVSWII
jgi:hypothetical protein